MPQYDHIIISLRKENEFGDQLKGIKIFYLDLKGYLSIPRLVGKVKKIISSCESRMIVHAHMFWANIISRLAIPGHIPLFNSYHSVSYGSKGANYPFYAILLDRLTYNKRVNTLCVSSAVKENIKKYVGIRDNVEVLFNYVNDKFYTSKECHYQPGNVLRLVSVGNLKQQKNHMLTLEAMSILRVNGHGEKCTLDIFGRGPLLQSLKDAADKLGLNNVHFKGSASDIPERLKQYDAYVLSSSYEGFGIAIAEAMASELPLIVSDLPVIRDVTNGHGLFFNPKSPSELVKRIESVLSGEIDLVSLSTAAKQRAELYRKENYLKILSSIYDQKFFEK
jgi:glycosyltransferase involved in cell wall biosynthesis